MPSSRITSLLEGLEFTPPSSARPKGDTRYIRTWYVYQHFLFDFPFDEIYRRLLFHSYQIRMYNTCPCTINSTAVSLFVYSLVGGGTHDTYAPPVDAHVWRQLHVSAVARCSDSYCCIFRLLVFFFRSSYFSGGVFLLCSRTRYASTWFAYLDSSACGFSLSHCLWPHNLYLSRMKKQEGHWGHCWCRR